VRRGGSAFSVRTDVPSPHSGGRELTKDREKNPRLVLVRRQGLYLEGERRSPEGLESSQGALAPHRGEDGSERRVSPSESVHRSFVPASESKLAGVSKHALAWAHPSFGSILASCSFDGKVFIWKENDGPQKRACEREQASGCQ
jgi:WD40 repeat protein